MTNTMSMRSRRDFLGQVGLAGLVAGSSERALAQSATPPASGHLPWIDVTDPDLGADPSGHNDSSAAIQKAFDRVPAAGGMVLIPAGRYRISRTLKPRSNTRIFGMWGDQIDFSGTITNGSCLVWMGGSGQTVLVLMGVEYVDVDGLSIANGSHATEMTGILVDSKNPPDQVPATHNISIAHLAVNGFHTGVCIGSTARNSECDAVTIRQSRIIGDGLRGSIGFRSSSDNAMDGGGLFTVFITACDYSIWIDAIGFATFQGIFTGGNVEGGNGTSFVHLADRHDALQFLSCESENHDNFLVIPSDATPYQDKPLTIESCVINGNISVGVQRRIVSIGNTLSAPCVLNAGGALVTSIGDGGAYTWTAAGVGNGAEVLALTPGGPGQPLLVLEPSSDGPMLTLRPRLTPSSNPNVTLDGTPVGAHQWAMVLPGSAGRFRSSKNLVFLDQTSGTVPLQLHDNGIQIGDGATVYSGTGVPNVPSAVPGDYYLRKDAPTVSLQRIYIATGPNSWAGIL